MKDNDGKKIHILDARSVATQSILRTQNATMLDLVPINEALLNAGAGLSRIAELLQDYETRIGVLEMDAIQAQSIHPYGAYGLVCHACRKNPRWVKPVRRADVMYYMEDPLEWECLLGCKQTPVRADGPGSRWQGRDLIVPDGAVLTDP